MHKSYLLIENSSKSNNLGPLLRCCAAYRTEALFVGYAQCSTEGSHGSARHVKITAVPTFDQAVEYLRGNKCNVTDIVGLLGGSSSSSAAQDVYDECEVGEFVLDANDSISSIKRLVTIVGDKERRQDIVGNNRKKYPPSKPVHYRPFRGNTAFFVSKNWRGLPAEQASICDAFVHIPYMPMQQSQAMFLDVQACLSIVLHHYSAWARYDERMYEGQKFEVSRYRKGEVTEKEKEAKAAMRARS